jgi:hypothetical protein
MFHVITWPSSRGVSAVALSHISDVEFADWGMEIHEDLTGIAPRFTYGNNVYMYVYMYIYNMYVYIYKICTKRI